jgi:hypothetical protein
VFAVSREQAVHVVFVDAPFRGDRCANHRCATAPGQIVRVVLHRRRENDAAPPERIAEGELVDGFGRVLPEDNGIGRRLGSNEARERLVRVVIGRGADA